MLLLEQPGERYTQLRKITHNQLGSLTAVNRWSDEINIEVNRYLLRTLEQPEAFADHLQRQALTVILKVVYGYEADQNSSDRLIELGKQMAAAVIEAGVPGAWLVDVLPALRYVPTWFPGAQWRRQAQEWHDLMVSTRTEPFEFTKNQVEAGTAPVSAVSESLLAGKNSDVDISWAALSMLGGGAYTTLATMEMFCLAMVMHPEVLLKAQKEIDRIVGIQRLVSQADRDSLPYTDALFKEVMRWEPIVEVNMPRCPSQDDTYDGYLIPKDAVILENVCGMMHDESIYQNAMEFRPERFLGAHAEMSPFDLVWGHGRRTCPGRHLAFVTLWLEMSRTIQLFDIKTVKDSPPRRQFTYGIIRKPLPFKADIKIRSAEHETLLRSAAV